MAEKSKVEQYLDTYKQIVDGAKERGLESVMTPDTIQRSAVSVFIADTANGNGHTTHEQGGTRPVKQGNSAPQNGGGGEIQNLSGVLEKKRQEKKTSKAGKPYTQYSIFVGGKWHNSLNAKVFGGKVFNEGDTIDFSIQQNDAGYWNLISVDLAADNGDPVPDPDDIPF